MAKSRILRDLSRQKDVDNKKQAAAADELRDVSQAAIPPTEKENLTVDNSLSIAATAVPTAPTGLASLDFELPTDKNLYEVYRFTTPRGEAELTARTVSNSTLTRLESLAGFAAAGSWFGSAFWLVRRGILVGSVVRWGPFCWPLPDWRRFAAACCPLPDWLPCWPASACWLRISGGGGRQGVGRD